MQERGGAAAAARRQGDGAVAARRRGNGDAAQLDGEATATRRQHDGLGLADSNAVPSLMPLSPAAGKALGGSCGAKPDGFGPAAGQLHNPLASPRNGERGQPRASPRNGERGQPPLAVTDTWVGFLPPAPPVDAGDHGENDRRVAVRLGQPSLTAGRTGPGPGWRRPRGATRQRRA